MKKFFLVLSVFVFVFVIHSSSGAQQINLRVADFVNRIYGSIYNTRKVTDTFIEILDSYSENFNVTASLSSMNLNPSEKVSLSNYMILGSIEKEDNKLSYTYRKGFLYDTPRTEIHTCFVTVSARLVETSTGEILFSVSGTGSASYSDDIKQRTLSSGSLSEAEKYMKVFEDTRLKAFSAASSFVSEKICAAVTGEYPEVTSVKLAKGKTKKKSNQDTVIINRGTKSGVCENVFYRIFKEGEEVFDSHGKSLGRDKNIIAVAEVINVRSNYSTAVIKGGMPKNIRAGYKAEQITREEAEKMIEK